MQSTDRPEFDALMVKLCEGLGKPPTPTKLDAYWLGLSKMSLTWFSRCVEHILGEHGLTELPTTGGIWQIRNHLRRTTSGLSAAPSVSQKDDRDHLEFFANRLLFDHLATRKGVGSVGNVPSDELKACLLAKRELVDNFISRVREGDPQGNPREMVKIFVNKLRRIGHVEEVLLTMWRGKSAQPDSRKPFPPYMARDLAIAPVQGELTVLA